MNNSSGGSLEKAIFIIRKNEFGLTDKPNGSTLYLHMALSAVNDVKSRYSGWSGTWWNPWNKSKIVKNFYLRRFHLFSCNRYTFSNSFLICLIFLEILWCYTVPSKVLSDHVYWLLNLLFDLSFGCLWNPVIFSVCWIAIACPKLLFIKIIID